MRGFITSASGFTLELPPVTEGKQSRGIELNVGHSEEFNHKATVPG